MINSFIEIYKDLFYFLRNPKDQQTTDQSVAQKVKVLITLIVLDIPLMGLLTVLVNAFNKLGWVKVENHQMTLLLDLLPIWTVLVLTIIIIPFIEEVIFRLVLRFKRNYLLQTIIYVLPGEENKTKNSILNFWNRKYFYIFYFSAIIFALIHVSNYDSKSTIFYLFPVLILPQFFLALFIGYLRVRYNFMLGYLMHALHNAFFMTIALLTISSSTPKLNTNNSEYSLKIEEVTRAKDASINYAEDSIQFIGTNFKSIIATLIKKDEGLIDYENNTLSDRKITLNFKNNSGYHLNKDSIILEQLSKIYSFKLESKKRTQKVYNLYIKDTLQLLKNHSQKSNEISNTSITSKNITLENATLEQIAKELSSSYKVRFESESSISQKLNITVPNGNFIKLESTLSREYGIYLKETEKEIEYIYISAQK